MIRGSQELPTRHRCSRRASYLSYPERRVVGTSEGSSAGSSADKTMGGGEPLAVFWAAVAAHPALVTPVRPAMEAVHGGTKGAAS